MTTTRYAVVAAIVAVLCAVALGVQNRELTKTNAALAYFVTVKLDSLELSLKRLQASQATQMESLYDTSLMFRGRIAQTR